MGLAPQCKVKKICGICDNWKRKEIQPEEAVEKIKEILLEPNEAECRCGKKEIKQSSQKPAGSVHISITYSNE